MQYTKVCAPKRGSTHLLFFNNQMTENPSYCMNHFKVRLYRRIILWT